MAPLRTKMSSTSLTRVRSSRIAAATVFISRTLGADSVSLASSACSLAASTSSRRNDWRTAVTRGPLLRDARDVEQQVVQQLDRRRGGVRRLAGVVQAAHLAVDVAEQSLQRHVAVEAALAQRLEHRTDHPPQLEQRLRDGVRLELRGDFRQRLEVLLDVLAADPAEQRELEARPQAAREVRGGQAAPSLPAGPARRSAG